MKDLYRILNLTFAASESEIKSRFRQLASIHHPDKNGGSKKSEEIFKEILYSYEILSDKQKRTTYDAQYKQYFQESESINRNNNNTKQEAPPTYNREFKRTDKAKGNYFFWIIISIFALLGFCYVIKTTTNDPRAIKQIEEQKTTGRPNSGEIDFKN